jgi:hypothetical protein
MIIVSLDPSVDTNSLLATVGVIALARRDEVTLVHVLPHPMY